MMRAELRDTGMQLCRYIEISWLAKLVAADLKRAAACLPAGRYALWGNGGV
jgi:hypothetical protein